jgi:hypothetical protein
MQLIHWPCVKIVFETLLDAAATAPRKLQGPLSRFDMPFDTVRGHRLIRRFGLRTLRDHWLIGHKKQCASRNVVGKSCGKEHGVAVAYPSFHAPV